MPPQLAERVTLAPPPSWVQERLLEENAGKSGSNPILLLDQQYSAQERKRFERVVRRLDTIQAVHEAAQWRHEFDPATELVTIHSLAVCRGERRVENAAQERLRFLQREENLDRLIIDGLTTVVALLEDVRIGDVLDLSFTVETHPRVFPDHFRCLSIIPLRTPVLQYILSVRLPTGHSARWKSNDPNLAPTIREDSTETEWIWKATNPASVEPEPNVPPWHFAEHWIQVSDFASWAEVAEGLTAVWPESVNDPEVRRLAKTWVSATDSLGKQAVLLLNFVQDEIRYLSLNAGLGGQIPAPPGSVIQRGFGDCKDKAFLAAHLFRQLGIPARPMLVNAHLRRAIRESLPTPDAFNHAIVEYEIDGQRHWVDVTIPAQGGSATSRLAPDFQFGLPVSRGVEDLEPIKVDSEQDLVELRETFLVDTAGRTSTLKVILTTNGREADEWRRLLALEGPDGMARRRAQFYQFLYPGATRLGEIEWRDDRNLNEFTLADVFDLPEVTIPTGNGRTCLFPVRSHPVQSALGFHESNSRRHPWKLQYPLRADHIVEIESPGLTYASGRAIQVKCPAFHFNCDIKERQGFLSLTYTLSTKVDAVLPAEFESFKKKVREVLPNTLLQIQIPLGSVIPWKKREAGNLLTPRKGGSPERRKAASSSADRSARPARVGATSAPVEPREIRRPNPAPSQQAPATLSRSSGGSRRRRASRNRRRFFLVGGVLVGTSVLLAMLLFLIRLGSN